MTDFIKSDWMNTKWRPAMGWLYMVTCTFDFIIFPVLWALLQATLHQKVEAWNPITLQGAGLYHLAMGAILGIAAYGRTQEKIQGVASGTPMNNFQPTQFQPTQFQQSPYQNTDFVKTTETFTPVNEPVMTSSNGKPKPFQPQMPEI